MEQELHSKKLEKHRQKMREHRESRQAEAVASEAVNDPSPEIATAIPEESETPAEAGVLLEEKVESPLNENTFREQMLASVSEEHRALWEQMEADSVDYRESLDETGREILDFYGSEAIKSAIESASEERERSEEDRLFMEVLFNDPDMKALIEIGVIPLMRGREQVIADKEAAQARLEKAKTELEAFEREREGRIQPEEEVLRLIEEDIFAEP